MELNRNQYFLAGLVIFVIGLQFRAVESFTLNETCSQFIAKRMQESASDSTATLTNTSLSSWSSMTTAPAKLRTVKPPRWLGFALMSVGAVLILHSLAMPKPG